MVTAPFALSTAPKTAHSSRVLGTLESAPLDAGPDSFRLTPANGDPALHLVLATPRDVSFLAGAAAAAEFPYGDRVCWLTVLSGPETLQRFMAVVHE